MSPVIRSVALICCGGAMFGGCGPHAPRGSSPAAVTAEPSSVAVESTAKEVPRSASAAEVSRRIIPDDFVYLGAFRLPEGSNGSNWEYSGYALTYRPDGDPRGVDDGFPGSLFGTGHDHHQMVSEIDIPRPVIIKAKDLSLLNAAKTLQPFADITAGRFGELEIPRAGLAYLPAQPPQIAGRLCFCWGQHYQSDPAPSHGWCELELRAPRTAGPWRLKRYTNYATNDYLFAIPESWARQYTPGKPLATGRFRDGGWGGLGPALFAYNPGSTSDPPPRDAVLQDVAPLLLYGVQLDGVQELQVADDKKMNGYSHADEWSGGAWLTLGDRSAVIFTGTKAVGNTWYGFSNGVVYPTSGDPNDRVPPVPPWPFDVRGWWSERISAQIIFYDPQDLAAVAQGHKQPWEPQPYASLAIDKYLVEPGFQHERQKRYLLGDIAFDRTRALVYVVERMADGDKSLIHVFRIGSGHQQEHAR